MYILAPLPFRNLIPPTPLPHSIATSHGWLLASSIDDTMPPIEQLGQQLIYLGLCGPNRGIRT